MQGAEQGRAWEGSAALILCVSPLVGNEKYAKYRHQKEMAVICGTESAIKGLMC